MIIDRVAALMEDILQRDVDGNLTLDADGGVGPMDVARFVIACEKAFGVQIMDEYVADWQSLQDASDYIEALLESGEAGKTIREDDERTGWYYA